MEILGEIKIRRGDNFGVLFICDILISNFFIEEIMSLFLINQ